MTVCVPKVNVCETCDNFVPAPEFSRCLRASWKTSAVSGRTQNCGAGRAKSSVMAASSPPWSLTWHVFAVPGTR